MNEFNPDPEPSKVYRFSGLVNKKKIFEKLAELLATGSGSSFHRVLDGLNAREKVGSTCIGKGVAIPHCKLATGSAKAAIMILDEAVKYSEDGDNKVDIVFGLVVPSDNCKQHLHILSSIAKLCEQENWLEGLRKLESEEEISKYISDADKSLSEIL